MQILSQFGAVILGYTGLGAVVLRRQLPLANEREQAAVAAMGVVAIAVGVKLLLE